MKVTRWGVSAIAALLLAGGAGFAGDTDELNAMKATMDNMKQEMEAMRATMATEREAMRANAGGAPESLKSANGKATVKIGGKFQVRYNVSYENGYGNATSAESPTDNTRYTRTNWDIYKAELNFTIDLTPDTMGYIALRPDRGSASVGDLLDEVWWKWSNIGGTGFSAKVGLQTLDMGMYNGDNNPWSRVMILDPFVKTAAVNAGQMYSQNGTAANMAGYSYADATDHATDITALGVSAAYKWDQFKVVAGIYGQVFDRDAGQDNTLGVTTNGTARNIDIENHYVTGYYDPCWLENLHLQASYFGEFDHGSGASGTTWWPSNYTAVTANNRGSEYVPGFDFGVSYLADKWAVYAESTVVVNPQYYRDSIQMAYSVGADYSLTEKLKVGGSFDWMSYDWDGYSTGAASSIEAYTLRGALAAKYDFGNGLYVQAQYSHYWTKTWGVNDSKCKDADAITLQTGFEF